MKNPILIEPQLADYELIDSGDGAKLERFGDRITARPEPQAIWRRSLPESEWVRLAGATFRRSKVGDGGSGDERGEWQLAKGMPERWTVRYDRDGGESAGGGCVADSGDGRGEETHGGGANDDARRSGMHLRMRLALTGFKHVGIFPEQAANWDFIYDKSYEMASTSASVAVSKVPVAPKVLNLFAYTGGATLAARSAGADVTHVDSVKQTVSWARDNAELSGLGDGSGGGSIRWIVDDALKFARREVRRGNTYDGIVLDPPAYGRGPDGEKWVLEQNIDEMLALAAQLLKPHGFFVLNLYSMGLSAMLARTAVHTHFGVTGDGRDAAFDEQFGELYFTDRAGKQLPLGVYYRFVK